MVKGAKKVGVFKRKTVLQRRELGAKRQEEGRGGYWNKSGTKGGGSGKNQKSGVINV